VTTILVASELFPPEGGGAEYATYLYVKELLKAGYDVVILTFTPTVLIERRLRHKFEGRLKIIALPFKHYPVTLERLFECTWMYKRNIADIIKKSDVTYVAHNWFNLMKLAYEFKKPIIGHLHDVMFACPHWNLTFGTIKRCKVGCDLLRLIMCKATCNRVRYTVKDISGLRMAAYITLEPLKGLSDYLLWSFFRRNLICCNHIICVSNTTRNVVETFMPLLKSKLSVVYNPIPRVERVKPYVHEIPAFLYLGGTKLLKGILPLLLAIKRLCSGSTNKRFRVKLGGEFYNTFWLQIVNKMGITPYVEYIGYVNRDKLSQVYENTLSVVMPSIGFENMPYTLIEAMLHARIPITSNNEASLEILQGFPLSQRLLVNPCNIAELVEKMNSIMESDTQELYELGIKLREHVIRKFNAESSYKKFLSIFDRYG
jgi:glycosyltransferase involved in cell wall biosynthesis